ncbi:MAG: class I SAM-dependent methyltransferase [Micrococcaceae bacterium]
MSPVDRDTIAAWATTVDGPIIDAGCGPGHWTEFLRDQGASIQGIDLLPEFIDSARARFPQSTFRQGSIEDLPCEASSVAGILAWYSVIHLKPDRLPVVVAEFTRCLRTGGSLFLEFFEGPTVEAFDHAVTTAYFWPVETMSQLLHEAGFRIDAVQLRTDPGRRPHAAIEATLTR